MKREERAFFLDLKALMDHAIFHQQSGTKLDMRLAINHAHQAVELTLRKKAELLGLFPRYFPEIIKELRKKGVTIPYGRQIEELNEARRLTQHYGTTPNDNDARRLVFVARDFLIDFWKDAFAVDYDGISMFDLLSNEDVKKTLQEAQKYYEKHHNYGEATTKSVLAIYKVKWWIRSKFSILPRTIMLESFPLQEGLDEVLNITLSGPFTHKLRKLGESTGIIFLQTLDEPVMQQMKEHDFVREDALSALELATEYALWAEQVYG